VIGQLEWHALEEEPVEVVALSRRFLSVDRAERAGEGDQRAHASAAAEGSRGED
jgi:hypothetical protein